MIVANAEAAIEHRVVGGYPRLQLAPVVWPAVAAGVGELQADEQIRGAPEPFFVGVDEYASESGQVADRVVTNAQLIRVGAAFVHHRHGSGW